MTQKMALAIRPGTTVGRAIRKKAPKSVQPSVRAASSMETGAVRKKENIIQTTKALLSAVLRMMTAHQVPRRPMSRIRRKNGMSGALRESGFAPEDVDYVVAHGTGTPVGDVSETVAIKRTFGEHAYRLAVTSPKSMIGHTTCAAGALNMLAALGAMRDGVISPTINYDNPHPELDLDFIGNQARAREVRVARTNAFAFGGTNGALVVCRPDVRNGDDG